MNRTTRHARLKTFLLIAAATPLVGCVTSPWAANRHTHAPVVTPVPAPENDFVVRADPDRTPPTISLVPHEPATTTMATGTVAPMIPIEQPDFEPAPSPPTPVHGAGVTPIFSGGRDAGVPATPSRLVSLWGDELVDSGTDVPGRHDASANVRQVSFGTEGSTFDPDINQSGTALVFSSTRHRATADIYLKSVNGTTVTQLTSDPAHDIMPEFDPTGQMVAFASDRSGHWNIYTMSVRGGQPVQLTGDRDPEMHPTWSPDGSSIAYCRFGSRTGRWEIWMVDVRNPSTPSFLTYGVFPSWSPDVTQQRLLFQRPRERGSRFHSIWTIDVIGGEARRPTEISSAENAALINPSWSPDGRKVTFAAVVDPQNTNHERPDRSDIWVIDIDGLHRTNLTNGQMANFQPVWSSNGSIYFVSDRSGSDNIWAVAAGGPVEKDMTHPGHDSMANVLMDVLDAGDAPE